MLRKLTEEAWLLYLKVLDIERISDLSVKHEERIYRLTDQTYRRYLRRRNAWEFHRLLINRIDCKKSNS